MCLVHASCEHRACFMTGTHPGAQLPAQAPSPSTGPSPPSSPCPPSRLISRWSSSLVQGSKDMSDEGLQGMSAWISGWGPKGGGTGLEGC